MATQTQKKTRSRKRTTAARPDPPVAALLHADGCPAERDREEAYREITPDGERVVVSRCLDCPAHRVVPE